MIVSEAWEEFWDEVSPIAARQERARVSEEEQDRRRFWIGLLDEYRQEITYEGSTRTPVVVGSDEGLTCFSVFIPATGPTLRITGVGVFASETDQEVIHGTSFPVIVKSPGSTLNIEWQLSPDSKSELLRRKAARLAV
jgi:hypothetical protein